MTSTGIQNQPECLGFSSNRGETGLIYRGCNGEVPVVDVFTLEIRIGALEFLSPASACSCPRSSIPAARGFEDFGIRAISGSSAIDLKLGEVSFYVEEQL